MVQPDKVRSYVGVASTVVGVVCYALSSSFNRLYGDWNSFKICAYIAFSSIVCLAVWFPRVWQDWWIFHYRAHFTYLVLTSTTVYSFYLDIKMKTKPDAYGPISSAAFAMTSLCMSKHVKCGFVDLLYFFCTILVTQLMKITPFLGFVGIGFSYFAIILRSYLDEDPSNTSQSQPSPQPAIDMPSSPQSWSSSNVRPPQEDEGNIQNQAAITPVSSFAALLSASLRSRPSRASRRSRALDIQNQAITEAYSSPHGFIDYEDMLDIEAVPEDLFGNRELTQAFNNPELQFEVPGDTDPWY